MARFRHIVCAVLICLPTALMIGRGQAQNYPDVPAARLIRPRIVFPDRLRIRPPLDERCRPLKEQLEIAMQRAGNPYRAFQARLAHNAGTRLCREGQAERGMAEFQKGLSYLPDYRRP